MHELLEVHDTSASQPDQVGVLGNGVRSIDHLVPFQCSTNGIGSSLDRENESPTAMQSRDEVHDTPSRSVSKACAGRGAGWIDHPVAPAD